VKKEPIDVSHVENNYNVNDQTPDVKTIQFSKFLRENPSHTLRENDENYELYNEIKIEFEFEDMKPGMNLLAVEKIENNSRNHSQDMKFSSNYESQNNVKIETVNEVKKELNLNSNNELIQENYVPEKAFTRKINNALRSRISNDGSYADEGEYPYHGALMRSGAYWCGASLVSARHVLTAAHCVKDLVDVGWPGGAKPRVKLGSTSLETSRVHEVSRISYHRDYDPVWLLADIAVVTLSEPVVFSRRVRPIDLPKPFEELPPGRRLIVTGYGRDDRSRARSVRLKPLATRLIGNEQCSKDWFVTPSKLCTLRGPNNYGTCTGDSGGPLASSDKRVIYGVVSSGAACPTAQPDVYTKVSHFVAYVERESSYFGNRPSAPGPHPARLFLANEKKISNVPDTNSTLDLNAASIIACQTTEFGLSKFEELMGICKVQVQNYALWRNEKSRN
ncbi:transmembrane protease serine 11D-like, partial [Trichogramma pretiosum]|uniref:transmembrane protease serine 11D-like n=1 Tax=Trichogramma pretiosum TaxID=7493 RepID=UPI000C71ACD4